MPAPTLDGRLLCASGAAYAITGSMKNLAPDPTDLYYEGAGFLQEPSIVVGGDDSIEGCLVGQTSDGVVLAFRGTMPLDLDNPPSIKDWVCDFHADPISVSGYPGCVHSGFSGALAVLWPGITEAIGKLPAGGGPLYITGHSKGGAMAALAAWRLKQTAGMPPLKVVTFAGAKPADADFRAAYQAANIDQTRYEYNIDIVPHLPLSDQGFLDVLKGFPLHDLPWFKDLLVDVDRFDYQPVGTLRYIQADGQIIDDSDLLRRQRDQAIDVDILFGRFGEIAANHSIGCGSGYMKAIVPTGVCPPTVA